MCQERGRGAKVSLPKVFRKELVGRARVGGMARGVLLVLATLAVVLEKDHNLQFLPPNQLFPMPASNVKNLNRGAVG